MAFVKQSNRGQAPRVLGFERARHGHFREEVDMGDVSAAGAEEQGGRAG